MDLVGVMGCGCAIWEVPFGVNVIGRSVGFLATVKDVDKLIAGVRPQNLWFLV